MRALQHVSTSINRLNRWLHNTENCHHLHTMHTLHRVHQHLQIPRVDNNCWKWYINIPASHLAIGLNPSVGSMRIVVYKPFKSMTEMVQRLKPIARIDDRCHASHQASVGRSPREHCISRLPELISSFYCRQTNAVSISRKRDPILLGPREGGKNQTA